MAEYAKRDELESALRRESGVIGGIGAGLVENPAPVTAATSNERPDCPQGRKVLVADDEPSTRRVLEGLLTNAGYVVFAAPNGMEALRILNDVGPQIVIADWEMPFMNGLQLCHEIRHSETVGFVYVIILTSHTDRVVEAFDAGADDFLTKPPRKTELLARLKAAARIIDLEAHLARQNREIHKVNAELSLLNRRLREMAATDELTGLANRRVMMERLKHCWETASRNNRPLSCMVIDVDHFKQFNDNYGHDAGDMVLKAVASTLAKHSRSSEPVFRCGGEEFVLICPDTPMEKAAMMAECLRQAVGQEETRYDGLVLRATISIGVSQRDAGFRCPDDLLRHADGALYAAKASGRNCVRVDGPGYGDRAVGDPASGGLTTPSPVSAQVR